MKRKIKDWAIRKLGGVPRTQKIEYPIHIEPREVVKVQVERAIPFFQLDLMSPEEEADTVNRCLGNLLGSGLMDSGYVNVSVKTEPDKKIYYGSLKIVKEGAE